MSIPQSARRLPALALCAALGAVTLAAPALAESPAPALHWALTDLGTLGGESRVAALNGAGQAAGYSTLGNGDRRAFRSGPGGMIDLGTLSGTRESGAIAINGAGQVVRTGYGMAVAINASGQVAGFSSTDYGESIFLYSGGRMIDLGARLRGRYHAVDHQVYLNDAGQVAGSAISDLAGQPRSFLLTPLALVPAPAPLAMFALGLAAIGLAGRRPGRRARS